MTHEARQPEPPKRVLIIKPSALGDIVTAMPVLRGLKRTFPEASVAWLVADSCAGLITHDSQLDEAIIFRRKMLGRAWRSATSFRALTDLRRQLKQARFDWVIDLQGLLRSALLGRMTGAQLQAGFADAREGATIFYNRAVTVDPLHTVQRNIALAGQLGIEATADDMTLEVSEPGKQFAADFTSQHSFDRFVVCAPDTRWETKLYPERHWRKVVASLAKDIPVVIVAPRSAQVLGDAIAAGNGPGVINLTGQTGVEQMVGLIAASSGVICSDSAPKFIAPAVGVDCVTLLGPTQAERTGPYPRGKAIIAPVPCQGCLKRHCAHITCMEAISPDEVVSVVNEMLDSTGS